MYWKMVSSIDIEHRRDFNIEKKNAYYSLGIFATQKRTFYPAFHVVEHRDNDKRRRMKGLYIPQTIDYKVASFDKFISVKLPMI